MTPIMTLSMMLMTTITIVGNISCRCLLYFGCCHDDVCFTRDRNEILDQGGMPTRTPFLRSSNSKVKLFFVALFALVPFLSFRSQSLSLPSLLSTHLQTNSFWTVSEDSTTCYQTFCYRSTRLLILIALVSTGLNF